MHIKIIQKVINKIRNKPQGFDTRPYHKSKLLMEMKDEITDLFLGLSYGQYGIDPRYLTNPSFNYCFPSADLYSSYKMYSYYCDVLPKLKNVYIAAAFYSPGFCLAKSAEKKILEQYELFCGVKNPNSDCNNLLKENLKSIFKKKFSNIYNGYCEDGAKSILQDVNLEQRVASHYKQYSKYGYQQLEWLNKLSQLTKLNGHKLSVILFPFTKEYEDELITRFNTDFKTANRIIINFCSQHNINIIDFTALIPDIKYYIDYDHLNAEGAKILSTELNKYIQSAKSKM